MSSTIDDRHLIRAYLGAKEAVIAAGFENEIDWQAELSFEQIDESDFLREAAWVILSSGMRESVIRSKFAAISDAFLDWESASAIDCRRFDCRHKALLQFNHGPKVDAILAVAKHIAAVSFPHIRECMTTRGIEYLDNFAFIGPVTRWHLAKNLGLNVIKPDRHLVRISEAAGFVSPLEMCTVIAEQLGEKLAVVDVVLWRFATINSAYIKTFQGI